MKKKLLTSFIENQKFVLNNKLHTSSKKYPFSKTTERFENNPGKDDLKGTLSVHKKASLKCSLSLDYIISNYEGSKKELTKNKSQPLINHLPKYNVSLNEPRTSKKKQIQVKNNGYASGSIYNLLMSTPKEDKYHGRKRFINLKHVNNNIFGMDEHIKGNKNSISLNKNVIPSIFPIRDKYDEVYERMKMNKKNLENEENRDIYMLKKNLSNFKGNVRLNKSSSKVFNNSLLSTKDINSLRSKINRSIESNKSNDNPKLNTSRIRLLI